MTNETQSPGALTRQEKSMPLKIDELLGGPKIDIGALYRQSENLFYRVYGDQWFTMIRHFGEDWLPPAVLSLVDEIDRDIVLRDIQKHKGTVIVPAELGENLPAVSALLSATKTTASVPIKIVIGDKQAAEEEIRLSGEGMTVPVLIKGGGKAEEMRTALEAARERANEFYERWIDLIDKAGKGDQEAIVYLTAGMWAHIYTASKKVTQIDGWKELLLKDPIHDSQFMDIIRLQGSKFGLYDVGRIVGGCNFNSPQEFVASLQEKVKEIIEAPSNPITREAIPESQRLLLEALDRVLKYSSVGRALLRGSAVMAAQAADDCDFGALIQTYLDANPQTGITGAEGLVRLTSRRGLPGSIKLLQNLLDQVSRFAGHDVRFEIREQIDLHKGEDLKSYDELLGKTGKLKLDPLVSARLTQNLATGKVIAWLWGVTGTAKTTTAAILAKEIREREPTLAIVAPIEQTPEGVTEAIRQAMADIALGKPTLLVIDDAHLALREMTDAQVHDLQNALDTVNAILGKVEVTGGIILAGEHPPKTHALGMPHRALAIEMTLWRGDQKRDSKLLKQLCETKGIDTSKPKIKPILDAIGRRIQEEGTGRKYLSGSFLLDQIQVAIGRIDDGENMKDIIDDLEVAMKAQMSVAAGERAESAAGALESRMAVVEERIARIETELMSVLEIAEIQDNIGLQLKDIQGALSLLKATMIELQGIIISMQTGMEGLTEEKAQPGPGKSPLPQVAKKLFGG